MKSGKTLRNTLLVLAALALAVFLAVSFGLFSPSAHMWPSRVEGGQLYYTRHNCTLAYTPGGGSALLKLPWDRAAERRRTHTPWASAALPSARTGRSSSKTAKTSSPRASASSRHG